ncbi:MAG: uracil-DNA glycosylase family protein [Alphaproteobacteria bacterium]|nr:uracil-DNA glycosylase family protein [Alphaproteobacteria bacterium]
MTDQEYQKNILMELMNIEEFKIQINSNKSTAANPEPKNIKISKTSLNPYDSKNINDLTSIVHNFLVEKSLKLLNNNINLVEGNKDSKILFFYGYCKKSDTKIIDGEEGVLFDKMLNAIDMSRNDISLLSYIPRQLEDLKDNEEFNLFNQLMNYKLIELINPKYLILLGNFPIKMLLGSDLSSMSLRGKWFDFNTPNDTIPKKTRVLYEPKILMNNTDLKKDAWQDLKDIKAQIGG